MQLDPEVPPAKFEVPAAPTGLEINVFVQEPAGD